VSDPSLAPFVLLEVRACKHKSIASAEHYQWMAANKRDSSSGGRLPQDWATPFGIMRAYTDNLALTKCEPKKLTRKI
jgi:hypothetical protein